jgi:hypothetical protein
MPAPCPPPLEPPLPPPVEPPALLPLWLYAVAVCTAPMANNDASSTAVNLVVINFDKTFIFKPSIQKSLFIVLMNCYYSDALLCQSYIIREFYHFSKTYPLWTLSKKCDLFIVKRMGKEKNNEKQRNKG